MAVAAGEADAGSLWDRTYGTTVLSGTRVLRYPLTEDEGLRRNLAVVRGRSPDAVLFTGDLVQGGGHQPGWDEFFRHTAGASGDLLTGVPIIPAFGNWESFGAINGGYGTPEDRTPVVRSRAKFHAYFDGPPNGTPEHRDNYHRIDYGPVTVLTLDSNNGEPDDSAASYPPEEKLTGREYTGPGTDTQENVTRSEYEAAGGRDLSDYSPGGRQGTWVEQQLRDARAAGDRKARITLTPVHVFPVMDDALTVLRTERRTYSDRVVIDVDADGRPAR
ncbi:hypothetical protein E1295_40490 [Nonomuraea mesophila]|uniref:Calcineurin-like phosphoesterase domain-containing protein n=1 Tax=Nonomuraea mesophila TaxID=2530382 RepID=A0A4R5ECF4_9ACTN|nr:metallophosphoesterase [Nonomuraea mesophila]TDE31007.1 hypothetical protein E1295_40490 [Nonomuraea mesophila]